MNTPEKRAAVLQAIKRHRFTHADFSALLAAIASKAADMQGLSGMDQVSEYLDEAADAMDDCFARFARQHVADKFTAREEEWMDRVRGIE